MSLEAETHDLAQQAERHGVALRYHSFWGEDLQVAPEVLAQALDSMGLRHAPPPAAEGLPPVQVVAEGEPARIAWTGGPAGGRWQLTPEDGGESSQGEVRREGELSVIELPPAPRIGYWRLVVDGQPSYCLLVVAPKRCWAPQSLLEGQRWWGCTIQLYALRSARNWGIGDFGDLRRLVDTAARQGASFIGLSPLHALFPHRPEVASPYSPSSRTALNPIYLDVQALAELSGCEEALRKLHGEEFQHRLRRLREAELVDYPAVAAAKEEMLAILWRHFEQHEMHPGSSRGAHFASYMQERETTLGPHALFEAVQGHLYATDPHVWGWPAWPEAWRDPEGEAVRAFRQDHASAVRYRFWLQWLCEVQLESVQRYARTRGMGLGLYCDLAVGVNEGGAETWMQPSLYALGMHVGAPPDPLNALGQNWGLPPLNPVQLQAARYAPFIETLRANMRHCGALRMDHVMALMRLFWIGGRGGTYVTYPLQDLLGILALESHRHRCLVIGEDLGNVAPAMRDAMRERSLLSYRPLLFERAADGSFRPPGEWQPQALAVVSTHDLPTLRGFWLGEDLELVASLGLFPDEAARERAVIDRSQDRARLLLALQHQGLLPPDASAQPTSVPDATPAFVAGVYAYLARTPSWLVGVQLEDVTGQRLQVNVPGTTEDRFPNWRRKLSVAVEDLASDERFAAVAAVLRAERSGPAPDTAPAELPPLDSARIPVATYRVQFHEGCRFTDVAEAVPYLHALGISHLYSSPFLRARPGSTHGYDIVDHGALNPEVGDEEDFERMCRALRRHGMGQMLDLVPNHMGVLEADNAWWLEMLEHGQASAHSQTFDIEWQPAAPEMAGRVLLPVLGDHYGRVLESGELQLHFNAEAGEFGLRYWNHRFPVDPATYPGILAVLPAPPAQDEAESDSHAVVASLLASFERLPPRDSSDDEQRRARVRDASIYKRNLARLVARNEWLQHWVDSCVQRFNGNPADPASFDLLDRLLSRQAYRLADWHTASDDVNYRRFFDVNTLAALRMERQEVFEATHARVLQWLQDGHLDALRLDHPDGLSDPQQYFQRLQARHARQAEVAGREPRALYLVVEKILAEHEPLSHQWPVHGDTGYRFASLVNGLFVDGTRAAEMERAYRDFSGEQEAFTEIVYQCKRLIIETSLFSELNWLVEAMYRITRANRRRCDFTRNRLRLALAEIAAGFPVYRTYLRPGDTPSPADRRHIDWAVAAALRRLGGSEAGVLDHVREVLLGEGEAAGVPPEQRGRFLARWQQFTSPVMAKAVEDTAFYRYLRLTSLNEVGGEPASYGLSVAAFHGANQARERHRPHCLLATSTHDSKRGEDLRARIDVLSELPQLWTETLQRWAGWAEMYLTETEAGVAPSRNDIWLLFQTLAGLWPAEVPHAQDRESLRLRLQEYMRKAVREAKQHTSWTCPDKAYEDALARYIDAVLRPGSPNPFVDELQKFTARVAPWGWRNSLAQVALKFTVPGVPDVYQGCEQWNFSLVDPDNRRPVDFGQLQRGLAELQAQCRDGVPPASLWRQLHAGMADGRIKHLVTWRLLQLRQAMRELFRDGAYQPLAAEGPAGDHAIAFLRTRDDRAVLVVAARLACTLCDSAETRWTPALWRGTQLRAAEAAGLRKWPRWRNWLTGEEVAGAGPDGSLAVETLFAGAAGLPFAVLVAQGPREGAE
ncbi:malto-oligosyltrehalose synthase [Ramlibacter sp. Leaf400]|uniref:malto-oligosyltrehalose synthase n=1 Tax=Ramlibacter sp. Leaf400 TaxID=1736365 RepID=UPI0006FA4512|nr:malto-oligosyltrehalose synthase [Ramlibacter sp. Leaf400]KQT11012.1 4-alpha-glucanotransferase [Ramlibacter sp. Leaf400]